MMLLVRRRFEAAHSLPNYDGPCARLHGHTWRVDVEISGAVKKQSGMLVDFKDLKRAIDGVLPDHQHLNEVFPGFNPTAENLSRLLYTLIAGAIELVDSTIAVEKVTVWESDDCAAIFTKDDACYDV